MKARLNAFAAAPTLMKQWRDFTLDIDGLETSLMELVEMRTSQINGCAYCLHMHALSARQHGESEERLYLLDAWRESPLYNERERAALEWTEALTLVASTRAPDAAYEIARAEFSEEELVKLTML